MSSNPYPDTLKIVLPDAYLTAVGKVNVAWGSLEGVVDLAIRKFCGFELDDPRATILTAHMSWPQKMDILEALVVALKPDYPHLTKFDKTKALLKAAQTGRNKIAHGQLAYEDGQVYKLRATARGKLVPSIEPISLHQIDSIAEDINRAAAATLKAALNK